MTGMTRAYIDTRNVALGRELGLDRWYVVDVSKRANIADVSRRLARLVEVEDVSARIAFPTDVPNDPLHAQHWGHNNTGQMLDYCWNCGGHPSGSPVGTLGFDSSAQAAWDAPQGYGSSSVVIAIFDSGEDAGHPDLRQVAGWDYGDNDSNPTDDSTGGGHGTACAGVAAAINGNRIGTAGIAGGCSIMALKVASSAGGISFAAVANALIHAADNGAENGVDIASLSPGAAIADDPGTSSAISYANGNGVTILAATANSNPISVEFPANHSLVIAVGAASPSDVRNRVVSSCDDVTSVESGSGWDRYTGYGMVNAAAAVNAGPPPTQDYASLPYATGFEASTLDSNWTIVVGVEGRILVATANGPFAGSRHLTMDDAINAGSFSQNEAWLRVNPRRSCPVVGRNSPMRRIVRMAFTFRTTMGLASSRCST